MTRSRRLGSVLGLLVLPASLLVMAVPAGASRAPALAGGVSCGVTITVNTTLMNDVGPCTTPTGITLSGSNITLNLNGHSVIGDANPTKTLVGIHAFMSNGDTIENGQVYGFATGVYLEQSNSDTVTRMDLHDNIGPLTGAGLYGEGLQIFEGGSDVIKNDKIIHNGTFAGIDAYSTSNNTFTANQVVDNNILQVDAVHLGPKVMQDIGIWVLNLNTTDPAGATNNAITNNEVVGNGLDGIQVGRYTNGNSVESNEVADNGFGQVMGIRDGDGIADFGNYNKIERNTTVFNGGNGIRVVYSANSSGVAVGGQDNTVVANRSYANGTGPNSAGVAFDLTDTNVTPPCDSNTWSGNLYLTLNQSCVASH